MNMIVIEDYSADKLPEDIRARVGDSQTVKLIIAPYPRHPIGNEARYQRLLSDMATWTLDDSGRDSVERVRALRDEWDD
jgi:hypothetical protein